MDTDSPAAGDSARKSATAKPRATARPRAGVQRKTKAEREEYARKEAERAKERDPGDAVTSTRAAPTRGRGSGRGGRGASVVSKSERISSTSTSGVFGAGSGQRLERGRGTVDLGISEALDGGPSNAGPVAGGLVVTLDSDTAGVGRSGAGAARGRVVKAQEIIQDSIQVDEDAEDQPKRDIERIWISSDEDEDIVTHRKGKQRRITKSPRPSTSLRPVRAARAPLVDPDENKKNVKPQGQNTQEEETELETDGAQMDVISSASRKDVPSSPELSKRLLKKVDSRTRDPRVLIETVEEKAERLRLQEDTENMKHAFLDKSDSDDTMDSKQEQAIFGRNDHDRMFLFQLPPLIPRLRRPSTQDVQDVNDMDVERVQVKVEDAAVAATTENAPKGGEGPSEQPKSANPVYTADADHDQRFPEGYVGKLRVHKSGKVSLDWGGTDMEVRYGTEVDFLQDVICVEDDSGLKTENDEGSSSGLGRAYAMGQLRQKMVLIPDWSRLYA